MQEILSYTAEIESTSVSSSPGFTTLTNNLGKVCKKSSAEIAWKYYPAQVGLRYEVKLEGFPREEICDPSNLSVDELTKLRESLKDGTCHFRELSPEEINTLRATIDKQTKDGENPWGKRKRRSDAGKPKKKRKTDAPTVRLGGPDPEPVPPSCNSSDYQEDNIMLDAFNYDYDSASDSSTRPADEQPRKLIQKRSLKVAYHDDKSESGEDEVGWGTSRAFKNLTRSIESFGGGSDDMELEDDG